MKRLHEIAAAAALAVCFVMAGAAERPAHAIPVFDGANYSQNPLQAVRALQQINNQIQALTNQAQMLINQAATSTGSPSRPAPTCWPRSARSRD